MAKNEKTVSTEEAEQYVFNYYITVNFNAAVEKVSIDQTGKPPPPPDPPKK